MRFQVLRRGFFDYPALEIDSSSDGEASIVVSYGMRREIAGETSIATTPRNRSSDRHPRSHSRTTTRTP
jgi:hypothetical protein